MNAEMVLLMQADYVQRMRDHRFRDYVGYALSSFHSAATNPQERGRQMAVGLEKHVQLADAYRVTADMATLVQYAASQLDATDKLDLTLPPTPWGIVRFERPLPFKEIRGRTMLAHWMTWGPAKQMFTGSDPKADTPMMFLTFWNDPATDPDEVGLHDGNEDPKVRATTNQVVGRWAFIGGNVLRQGDSLGDPEVESTPVFLDNVAKEDAKSGRPTLPPNSPFTNGNRYAHALWLLLNQTVTRVSEETVPRRTSKRFVKMRIPGRVSVITLRREAGERHEGESTVEWSHRWLVRGHWAWRVCGSDHAGAVTDAPVKGGVGVRLWITGYVKGPEDKPFVVTGKVYQLSR